MDNEQAQDATTETVNSLESQVTESTATAQDAGQTEQERTLESYIAENEKLRKENASRRIQNRDLTSELETLKPLAEKFTELEEAKKSEEQKLREQLEALKQEKLQAEQTALIAQRQAKLSTLAGKAGVDVELLQFLDLSKFDFDNEDSILETLERFKPKVQKPSGGKEVNPQANGNNAVSEADLINEYFRLGGRNAGSAFGDIGG